jgi:hypothetical protein
MITDLDFTASMGFLAEMLPMQRALTPEALAMTWETLPPAAKIHLTPASLAFAVKQRLLDPQPQKEMALHIGLLRYVFPVERTTTRERGESVIADKVIFEHGPRRDLAQRMAQPDRFHDPAPAREEHAPASARRLAAGGHWHASMDSPEKRRDKLREVLRQVEQIRAKGDPGTRLTRAEEATARGLFVYVLQGFLPLKPDNIAALWMLRNRKQADEMIQAALAADGFEPPSSEAAVAELVGGLFK